MEPPTGGASGPGEPASGASSQHQASVSATENQQPAGSAYRPVGGAPVRVRRPRAIVFDILGTASKSGFLEKILFPYLKMNLEPYVAANWSKHDFVRLYAKIVDQSMQFNKQDGACPQVAAHESPEAKGSLLKFIDYVTENGIDAPAVTQLRFKVWFQGYEQSKLRTPIYRDVPSKLRVWFSEGIKFYVFSNTWVAAQKALLRNTSHGDLTNLISGHYDNDFGSLLEPDSWRRLCSQIHEQPSDVLFLTKSVAEARAAAEAGLAVVLVLTHRHNVKAVSREDRQRIPYVRTLLDLVWLDALELGAGAEPSVPAGVAGPPTAVSVSSGASGQRSRSSQQPASSASGAHSRSTAAHQASGSTAATTATTMASQRASSQSRNSQSKN